MKSSTVFFIGLAFMAFTNIQAQQIDRGNVCQSIPELTDDQQQRIDELSASHQEKMDGLRAQFRSESDALLAADLKMQMSNEQQNHFQNISSLLTPEQSSWYNLTCTANGQYYARSGYGQGQGRGYGRGQGRGKGRTQALGRGAGYGRSSGYGRCFY